METAIPSDREYLTIGSELAPRVSSYPTLAEARLCSLQPKKTPLAKGNGRG